MFRNEAIHDALLESGPRAAARDKVIQSFDWFVHDTPKTNFQPIRRYGIKRTDDGAIYTPPSVERAYGQLPHTVCLGPGPEGWARALSKPGPFMRLAIRSTKLPISVGLDWTNQYNWNLAAIIAEDAPYLSFDDVFAEVVRRTKVLVCYSTLPPKLLRVLVTHVPANDPSQWPSIWNVDVSKIADAS